ncbi:MAG TPA: phage tail terminator-like protein [Methylosinus sp.]|jgi:hypothetical protein|uniref:phage tail terminator-like protein n=1 Tax=Methylosinus sp. TaxID=427 RepID=UPI002F93DAF6
MTDAPEAAIPALLFSHLSALSLAPTLPIAWPDVPFAPTIGEAFLAVDYLPNRSTDPFLAFDDGTLYHGLLQVAVVTPRGSGAISAARIAAAIADHFDAGTTLRPDDQSFALKIDARPRIGGPIQEEKWTRTPVTVAWRAFV